MKERERLVVTGLVALTLLLWLGFLVHTAPSFAGSLAGGALGVSGALLMLVPLAYLVVKRVRRLKKAVTKRVSMRTLLAWHIYAGILGPILVLLHTGHKFDSPLGGALTAMTLVVVLSGFVGRYIMGRLSREIKTKRKMLATLQIAYDEAALDLGRHPERASLLRPFTGFYSRALAGFLLPGAGARPAGVAGAAAAGVLLHLGESIADMEYAIKTHQRFKQWFSRWLKFHIVISLLLYVLLLLHVWAGVHFGLRWFR